MLDYKLQLGEIPHILDTVIWMIHVINHNYKNGYYVINIDTKRYLGCICVWKPNKLFQKGLDFLWYRLGDCYQQQTFFCFIKHCDNIFLLFIIVLKRWLDNIEKHLSSIVYEKILPLFTSTNEDRHVLISVLF